MFLVASGTIFVMVFLALIPQAECKTTHGNSSILSVARIFVINSGKYRRQHMTPMFGHNSVRFGSSLSKLLCLGLLGILHIPSPVRCSERGCVDVVGKDHVRKSGMVSVF